PRRLGRCPLLTVSIAGFAAGFVDNTGVKRAAVRAILGGVSREEIAAWTERFVPWCLKALVRPAARADIAAHADAGHHVILASASLDLHVVPIAQALGFAEVICTKVAWTDDETISGDLDGDNMRADKKLAAVQGVVALIESEPRSATVI